MSLNPTALQNILPNSTRPERLIVASDPWGGIPAKNRKGERLNLYLGIIDILQCYKSKFFTVFKSHFGFYRGARWYKNERLPKSDDFRYNAVGTTHIIQSGHIMACWKGKSLNYIGKLVSDLF